MVGVPIWISALQPRPSPAQGISRDAVPRAGEGANEQRQDNEAGTGFLYFRAQEEILQLVNLDTISVHFSLCNQPICSSLCISHARPTAGRCLSGSVSIPVCPWAHSLGWAGPGWGSCSQHSHDPSKQQDPAQENQLPWGRAASPEGLEQFKGIAVTHR